jgi:trimeric autotransporter adhesin
MNDKFYFSLYTSTHGYEPWVCDGTATGTFMLKDIIVGSTGSQPKLFTRMGNWVFFCADQTTIWRTDGTSVGTIMVADGSNLPYGTSSTLTLNNEFYFDFTSFFSSTPSKLLKNDGTNTSEVKSIVGTIKKVVKTNNLIFFINKEGNNYDLWKSDGTNAGTQKLKTIIISTEYLDVRMFAGQSKCFFMIFSPTNTNFENIAEHWVTDGSISGTQKIRDLNQTFSVGSGQSAIRMAGENYYFSAYDDINGFELWKSNGTSSGTQLVKNVNIKAGSSFPKSFTALGNVVVFGANDIKHGFELWKTQGTANTTQLYADLNNIDIGVNYGSNILGIINFNNMIIAQIGGTLMKMDGINPPVKLNQLSNLNIGYAIAPEFTKYKNKLYYRGFSDTYGSELWTTDGFSVSIVKDLVPGQNSSFPTKFIVSGGFLYFVTDYNRQLWKSDGTGSGTILVKEFTTGFIESNLIEVNGKVFFSCFENSTGTELWVSDGTSLGTKLVKDIFVGLNGSYPTNLVSYNGKLYFSAFNGNDYYFWKTDGTASNTESILLGYNHNIAILRNKLYFIGYSNSSGQSALWESDGTLSNTKKIKNIPLYSNNISKLFNVEDKYLVFNFSPTSSLNELWITDGTVDGTTIVKTIRNTPNNNSYSVTSEYFYHNKKLYFDADDGINGKELWMWDFTCPDSYTVRDTLRTDTIIIYNKFIVGINKIQSNAKVNYNANNYIELKSGFDAMNGNVFTTNLSGCSNISSNAQLTSTSNTEPVFQASDLKNLGQPQPSIWQFLKEPSNVELRNIYYEQHQRGNAHKLSWIIQTDNVRYILKLMVDNREYLGYLPKR